MKKICLSTLLALSLMLNSSCYFMAAQSDGLKTHETKVTRSNEHIVNYIPVVRVQDIDLETQHIILALGRYPIVGFHEERQSVVGKADFGRTASNGTMGYGALLLLAGLLAFGALVPDSKTGGKSPNPDLLNALTSPTGQQGLLTGAGVVGSLIALDFLAALVTYIPSTRTGSADLEEAQEQALAPVPQTLVQLSHPVTGHSLQLRTDEQGLLALPIPFFWVNGDAPAELPSFAFEQDFALSSSAFNSSTQNLAALSQNLDESILAKLKAFEAGQGEYAALLKKGQDGGYQQAIEAARSLNQEVLLPEQRTALQALRGQWYTQEYEAILAQVDGATPADRSGIESAVQATTETVSPESPYYRQLQAAVPSWQQRAHKLIFQQAYNLAGEQRFAEALQELLNIPDSASFYPQVQKKQQEWQNLALYQEFNQANSLAAQQKYNEAIELAENLLAIVPNASPLHGQISKKIPQWRELKYHDIYLQAFRYANDGDMQAAIAQIAMIPKGAKDYKQAQLKIVQWKRIQAEKDRIASLQSQSYEPSYVPSSSSSYNNTPQVRDVVNFTVHYEDSRYKWATGGRSDVNIDADCSYTTASGYSDHWERTDLWAVSSIFSGTVRNNSAINCRISESKSGYAMDAVSVFVNVPAGRSGGSASIYKDQIYYSYY